MTVVDLTFPSIKYGRLQIPLDLAVLANPAAAATKLPGMSAGPANDLTLGRLELVVKLHEQLNGDIVGGGSKYTLRKKIFALRRFFSWADAEGRVLDLVTVATTFKYWADHLIELTKTGQAKTSNVYRLAEGVSTTLTYVLQRRQPLLLETRLRGRGGSPPRNSTTDKQNLADTFTFGHFLLDLSNALTLEVIFGHLPIKIPLHDGRVYEDWLQLYPPEKLKPPKDNNVAVRRRQRRENFEATSHKRHPVIHLRLEAELLMFVAQTGMNFAQAHSMTYSDFHFTAHLNGYQVRRYKERRGGEIAFEIHGDYKLIFERYLKWREAIFPDLNDGLLFPFINIKGRADGDAPRLHQVRKICGITAIRFIGPRELRNTRVNWILRRSQDPDLTAEIAQHTKEVLLRTYERPNVQLAMIELTKFHRQTDPAISPPGPGWCVAISPAAVPNIPVNAPAPDCATPAGCLFCTQHRDIDSEDHVWSLASFRYLKSLELMNFSGGEKNIDADRKSQPALMVSGRLTAKLEFYESSSEVRKAWVKEAMARVAEGHYHPAWDGFIQLQEA